MKTIGKKLKAIYLMAVIALVSICMSFIPLMTNTVKADVEGSTVGLRITGAQVKTIDGATQQDGASQFAVYFHAEITEEFYNSIKTADNKVQFGMLVGPGVGGDYNGAVEDFDAEKGAVVTNQTVEAGKSANFRFVGDELAEAVEFTNGVKTFEAGVVFDEEYLLSSGLENVLKKAASTKLTAMPYYVVDGIVTTVRDGQCQRTARDILTETALRIEKGVSQSDFDESSIDFFLDKYVGEVEFVEGDYYFDKHTNSMLAPNANNELVAFTGEGFMNENVVDLAIAGVYNGGAGMDMDAFVDGSYIGVSIYYADGSAKVLPFKVATKVLSKLEDFFVDVNGDGAITSDEMTRANYIFNLQTYNGGGAAIPTVAIKGLYVLANNIDLKANPELSNRPFKADGTNDSGELHVNVWNGSSDIGFRATLDGRGFALQNGNPYRSSAGMFGAFYGATVKNIAFDGFTNTAGNSNGQFLGYVYRSTFENVYIRAKGANGGNGLNWRALEINDTHGGSTFTNVVFESTDGLVAGKTGHQQRFTFITPGSVASGSFTNTSIVGMPVAINYGETTKGSGVYVLTLTLPASTLAALGVEAQQYAIADLTTTLPTEYLNLNTNLETKYGKTTTYINFVADAKEGRNHFLNKASLAANSELVSAYEESGCWIKLGDELLWKSLVDTTKITVDCSAENGEFKDSVSLDMYYPGAKLDAEITVSGAGADLVTVEGNTITRKENAQVLADKAITATLSYNGIVKTVDLTLLFDIDKVITYESGEFVIDKATGKVLKANANNELVAYDATKYLAGATTVSIDSTDITVANATAFAFDKASLTALVDGEKYIIKTGENLLVARVVTKVFFSVNDFFADTNSDGAITDDEKTQANNFFNVATAGTADKKVTGYYVLANNIDATGAPLKANNASAVVSNTSADFGFQATLDGRGFALSNLNVFNGAGLFGLIKNATIKDIAICNLSNSRDDSNRPLIANAIIDSTLENVYFTVAEYWIGWNQNYRTTSNAIGSISNSTLTNVIFENNAWKSNTANIQRSENSWYGFGTASTTATYTNTYSIGAPITVGYKVEVAATDTETAKHKLIFTLPLATIQKYVAAPGVYALADCGGAQNDFAKLISGMNTGDKLDVQYIEFVAETSTRGYFYDRTALASNVNATNALIESGCWTKVGGELVWTSTLDQSKFTVQTTAENDAFVESTTVDMYYNGELVNAELSVSKADAEFVAISGNTITKKAGVKFFADKVITVVASYQGIERTIDLTLLFDINSIETYEEGEFVIDKNTGKVLKADSNNKLVAYDATSYLASAEDVSVAGVAQTLANTTEFAFDKAGLESLVDGRDVVILAGENALIAKVVTRVLFTVNDFFYDLNGDGVIANVDTDGDGTNDIVEISTANSIFHLDTMAVSGGNEPTNAVKGYFVLGNTINVNYNSSIGYGSGDNRPLLSTKTIEAGKSNVGFMGTLDGRGFKLSKVSGGNASGGLFGLLNNATIKNIAFDDIYTTKNDGTISLLAYSVYNSTFENVYVSVTYPGAWGDTYIGEANPRVFALKNDMGESTLNNVIIENTGAITNAWVNKMARAVLGNVQANYINTNLVGMPAAYAYGNHASDADNKVLTLYLPASNIAEYGLTAQEYALADCEAVATDFAGLITNLQNKYSTTIGYIKLVEATADCGHYISNAALSANADAVATYVATGYWKVVDNALVWAK